MSWTFFIEALLATALIIAIGFYDMRLVALAEAVKLRVNVQRIAGVITQIALLLMAIAHTLLGVLVFSGVWPEGRLLDHLSLDWLIATQLALIAAIATGGYWVLNVRGQLLHASR